MDPALDPPPPAVQPTAAVSATAVAAANPTPAQLPAHNHPPYAEMITAAISALKERNGSSKRAIAKYIETHYSNLPPTHSSLLTHHLKRLKIQGQVLMVKHSYKLPRSAPVAVNGAVNTVSSDPASAGPKRRPGRPPKPKPEAGQAAVPVFAPTVDINATPVVVPAAQPQQNVAVGPVNGPAAGVPVRGRGRPPKQGGFKRGPGRPPKNGVATAGGGGGMGRARGRPKKNAAPGAAIEKGPGRPRGRPPRPINVVEGLAPGAPAGGGMAAAPVADVNAPVVSGGVAPVAGKRRGRPPKADGGAKRPRTLTSVQPKKPRKLSGKPLGRPKKNGSASVGRTPDSQLLVAYLDLKAKLENLQSRVKQTAALIKPSLNNETAINALQELELAAMNVSAVPNAQSQQTQAEQPQPQQPQPHM
ncbi:Histone H1 [Sesamum alatum]|uniref:Histone H1 n=1 Tax=Sesamum alatum TaxID=300844 RepID=A0AAE1XLR4_9LAMI|nr:Histone H1 [Sesamum alatum]